MSRTASERPPANGQRRIEPADAPSDTLLRVVNPLLALLLRSPLHRLVSDRLLLLTVTGRASGTEYTFPVLYERDGGTVRVTSYGTTWWKNLRDGGQEVTVHLEGERRRGHAEVEEDDRAVAEYVRGYLRRHGPDAADEVGLDLPDGDVPSPEALESAVDHVVLVTIDLDDD